MEKKILTLAGVLVLVATLVVSVAVFAGYQAEQEASTSKALTIQIKAHDGTTDVSTITFPAGDPSAEVTGTYNNVNGAGSPQVFGAESTSTVQLVTGTTYNLWWSVTEGVGWDTAVSQEHCYVTSTTAVTKASFDAASSTLSTWGIETNTTQQVTTANKYFYLTINLEAVGGKTGTSTLAVLGETP